MGFVFGTLFFQLATDQSGATNRVAIFFLSLIFICFSSSYKIQLLIKSRSSFFRETTANMYRGWVFYVTQLLADAAVFIPRATIFTIMVYFLSGLNLEDGGARFFLCWIGVILVFFLGLTIAESCAFGLPNEQIGLGVFTLLMTIQSLFAGFLVKEANIPDYWVWLYYINSVRYPLSFFCVNELDGLDVSCPGNEGAVPVFVSSNSSCVGQLNDPNCFRYYCPITSGNDVLDQFNMTQSVGFYLAITVVFVGGLRLINIMLFSFVNWVEK